VVKGMLGDPVGPAQLHSRPDPDQTATMRGDVEAMGFFDWVK